MDLVRLRDIGPVEPQSFAAPFFTISPDGRSAAFQLRQANPERNSYCLAMVVVDLARAAQARIVDEGGEPLLVTMDFRGIADFPTGLMRPVTPQWSGDGRWIAFLKNAGGTAQVWRAFADGSGSEALTHAQVDVVDFRISAGGSSIIYATRPGLANERREIKLQGQHGWHYDDRFVPLLSNRPLPSTPIPRVVQVLDITSRRLRAPSTEEATQMAADRQTVPAGGTAPLVPRNMEILATGVSGGAKRGSFRAHLPNGATATCTRVVCEGATSPWWTPGQASIRFFRREGWASASTAIYDWKLSSGDVRRVYVTDDVLSSCTPAGASLICLVDSSLEPRRLVRLNPASGKRDLLFDPNPEFSHLALGKPERLHWRNGFGMETVGDLVLPVGYHAGMKYPMIVVQYDTRGFLRGGTDDEYPIQAFANRGYAVLSFSRPRFPSEGRQAKDYEQAGRLDLDQFADRRSVQSSLEGGVNIAVQRGIADPAQIGITGLSDGTSTVEWALIHSTLFSAAAVSSCCWDSTLVSQVGPSAARHFLAEGYPGILGRTDPFWKQVSLSDNARNLSSPILVNASDEELLGALVTYTGLREAGVPVDMYVYPGEYHARWQPAHRLATYRRSLDWFDYWLRGVRSLAPDRQSELREWDRLKNTAAQTRLRRDN